VVAIFGISSNKNRGSSKCRVFKKKIRVLLKILDHSDTRFALLERGAASETTQRVWTRRVQPSSDVI